jgi:ADP-ribosylarginine hydrolase
MTNKNNIEASLIIGSYLDIIGFKNGVWEFNFNNTEISNIDKAIIINNEIVNNYYCLGGMNINIKTFYASDDTIMMIATKKAILNGGKNNDFIEEYLKINKDLRKDIRASGITTLNNLYLLKKHKNVNKFDYDPKYGGNGATMRTAYIGLYYYKESQLDKLIHTSIYSSRLTHNYIYGFLGGFVNALFCSFGLRKIDPFKWASLLIKIIPKVDDYMINTNISKEYNNDKDKFWNLWKKYIEERINGFEFKSDDYLYTVDRIKALEDYMPAIHYHKTNYAKMGATGIGCVLYAYDSLLMSFDFKTKKYNFDNLLYFSSLHFGDSDTTGIVAGNWYGAYNGYEGFPKHKIKDMEFYKELIT